MPEPTPRDEAAWALCPYFEWMETGPHPCPRPEDLPRCKRCGLDETGAGPGCYQIAVRAAAVVEAAVATERAKERARWKATIEMARKHPSGGIREWLEGWYGAVQFIAEAIERGEEP